MLQSTSKPRFFAIVPAAGTGRRMKTSKPKQYLPLAGQTVLEHTLKRLLALPYLHTIMVALANNDPYWQSLNSFKNPRIKTVIGGQQRCHSVLNALNALSVKKIPAQDGPAKKNDWVLVHDAVRPCIQPAIIERLVNALHDDPVGGLLAIPVTDTIKRTHDNQVLSTIDRHALWHAQTPQLFRYGLLMEGLTHGIKQALNLTDCARAIEILGKKPKVVEGSVNNIKITCPDDLALAAYYLQNERKRG